MSLLAASRGSSLLISVCRPVPVGVGVAAAAVGVTAPSFNLPVDSPPAVRRHLFPSAQISAHHQASRLSPRARFCPRQTLPLQSTTWTMEGVGDIGAKRKRSSIAGGVERPAKHLKPEGSVLTPGDATPANGTVYDIEEEEEAGHVLAVGPAQADSPEWQATIETVVQSVVSIHFCQTCSFDTELSMSSQATGFVVDAERGYILTNRHVVCAGPFWGYVIFDNHEEVCLCSRVHGACLAGG